MGVPYIRARGGKCPLENWKMLIYFFKITFWPCALIFTLKFENLAKRLAIAIVFRPPEDANLILKTNFFGFIELIRNTL